MRPPQPLAAQSDVAIVFVTQYMTEGLDGRLEMGEEQDALVAAVSKANPKTIVVVESGGAIYMPWVKDVPGDPGSLLPGQSCRPRTGNSKRW